MNEKAPQKDPRALIEQFQKGDRVAFDALYEHYYVPLYRYIYFRIRNHEQAEDLVHDAFVKVYRSLSTSQEKSTNPTAYFFTTARNTLIDYWRKKKLPIVTDSDKHLKRKIASNPNPLTQAQQKEILREIHALMSELEEYQQEVIILKFINGFSTQEIAHMLGKTEGAIRQLQSRSLKKLRERFQNSHLF